MCPRWLRRGAFSDTLGSGDTIQRKRENHARALGGPALNPNGRTKSGRARLHVTEPVSGARTPCGIEASAVILHQEADFAVARMKAHGHARGVAMTQAVADGLARHVKRFVRLGGR